MNEDAPDPDTSTAPSARTTKAPRKPDRLAAALKANMARRKAQARARADGQTGEEQDQP